MVTTDGAFGQVSGKVHEVLAVRRLNLHAAQWARGQYALLDPNPQSKIVDASVRRWFKGAYEISFKKSAGGAWRSIPKSPADVVIAVPSDQVAEARQILGGVRTVASSRVTTYTIDATTRRGLMQLATNGESAASLARAACRASVTAALALVAVGGLRDYRKVFARAT